MEGRPLRPRVAQKHRAQLNWFKPYRKRQVSTHLILHKNFSSSVCAIALWLARQTSDQAVWVIALAGDIVFCFGQGAFFHPGVNVCGI